MVALIAADIGFISRVEKNVYEQCSKRRDHFTTEDLAPVVIFIEYTAS